MLPLASTSKNPMLTKATVALINSFLPRVVKIHQTLIVALQ